jgi:Cys-tRNA(Pro)/Cys-tRNA(Cys) deacylase
MTPAIKTVKKAKIKYVLHEYAHDPKTNAYGLEAAKSLGVNPDQVFKTLVVSISEQNDRLAVGIVPVSKQLDLKALAASAHCKKAVMAKAKMVEKTTGYVIGGISPIGQRKRLQTFIDISAQKFSTVYVSAGKRGLQIELAPSDLTKLSTARYAHISR